MALSLALAFSQFMHDEVEVYRKDLQFKFKICRKLISEWVLEDDDIIQSFYSSVYPEAFYKLCAVHILTMYCTYINYVLYIYSLLYIHVFL